MTGRLETLLGIDVPIVLGPFGGLSSVGLTATVSRLGGLGSYGLYGYDAERIARTAAQLRAATDRPFALNLWLETGDEVRPGDVDLTAARAATEPCFAELGLAQPADPPRFLPDVEEQLHAALDARPAVLSVVYGVPPAPRSGPPRPRAAATSAPPSPRTSSPTRPTRPSRTASSTW